MEVASVKNLNQDEMEEKFKILQYKVLETHIEDIWSRFRDAGFNPILIKGWAASQYYPKPYRRQCVDIDLMVSPDCYHDAQTFQKSIQGNFIVDLHKGARHLDSVDFGNLFSNSLVVKCGKTEIRVLRAEDHLRILCIHWLNDGGANREKLWDIYYAVNNRSDDFDWDRLLNIVSLRRRKWIICAIGLAAKYLDLSIESTPISSEARNLPNWLVKAVEKEWASDIKLLPLHYFTKDKRMLWKQIKKRIPPNPIQATIEVEGEFDDRSRIIYQMRDIVFRLKPSLKRLIAANK